MKLRRIFCLFEDDSHRLLFKNTLWMVAGEVGVRFLTLLLAVFLARYLGVLKYGELQFAFAFTALFQFSLDPGFNILLVRDVSRHHKIARKYVENGFLLKILLSILFYVVLSIFVFFMNKPLQVKWLVLLAGVHLIFFILADFLQVLFQSFERFNLRSYSRFLYVLVLILGCGYVILAKGSVFAFMFAYVIAALFTFIITLIMVQLKLLKFSLQFDVKFWKRTIPKLFPFACLVVIALIFGRIDMVMLSFLKGEEAVGIYAISFNLFASILLVPTIVMSAAYPSFSRFFKHERDTFHTLFGYYFWLILAMGGLLGLLMVVFANPLIWYVFGENFMASVPVFQVFGVCLLFGSILNYISHFFIISHQQNIYLKVSFIALVLTVLLNYLLIGKFSYLGAAFTMAAVQLYQIIVLMVIMYVKGFRIWES